ncbi:MAG: DNA helicase RecQ [Halobacteriovoraceae bacterium]|nr:DNA helicase RecQ [Halobacteriovoraceae bacterium]
MSKTDQDQLLSLLKDKFGHQSFRFDQEQIIHSVIQGNDTLAIMPTGGGKSVCYQIPALYLKGITIVISPLISLMHDQVLNLEQNGIKGCFLNSSQSYEEKEQARSLLLSGEAKVLYISPEGLLAGVLNSLLGELEISLIAIDEAHCVSQWGHEFRNDYMQLGILKEKFPETPILALTATADERTRLDIASQLRMVEPKIFISSFDRPNISYKITDRVNEIKQLKDFIQKEHEDDTGIVYCLSRKKVEKVAAELQKAGLNAFAYHAGMPAETRVAIQKKFNVEENIIIVATIAFGMGIDKPNVRFVAHLDLPKSIEGYYQETGRAGRDGSPSTAWMIYGLQDVIKLSHMLESSDAHENYKKTARAKLDSMLSLCESVQCRRQYLLAYFGETKDDPCGNCDSCLEPANSFDALIEAQKLLSTIYRTGQLYGSSYIIDVLRGSENSKVLERSHDKISTYSLGKDKSKAFWNTLLRQLLSQGYIVIKNWEYRNLALTEKSKKILRAEVPFLMREHRERPSSSKPKKRSSHDIESNHGREDLFESLRQMRSELAKENGIPPYMVFSDKSLHDMCQLMPRNRDEFMMVNGVGASKCDKYSEVFIKEISQFSQ